MKKQKIKCGWCGDFFVFKRTDLDPVKDEQRIKDLGENMCHRCVGMLRGYPIKGDDK